MANKKLIKQRFDGYLPIIIDVETGGINPLKNALLEIAAIRVDFNEKGKLVSGNCFTCHVEPFEGSTLDQKALEINQIDPYHPFRFAIPEHQALTQLFEFTIQALKETECRRAVLVGHNAHFDLSFLVAATKRCKLNLPFHGFTVFDTATLGAIAFGKSVLAKALRQANIKFDKNEAHSAIYDAQKTTELFCRIVNEFKLVK